MVGPKGEIHKASMDSERLIRTRIYSLPEGQLDLTALMGRKEGRGNP